MAYWADVAYVFETEPNTVTVNAAEYDRVAGVLRQTAVPEIDRVRDGLDWVGDSRVAFDQRVNQAQSTLRSLGTGLAAAARSLRDYVPAMRQAKEQVSLGRARSRELLTVIESLGGPAAASHVSTLRGGPDPLRIWESIRPLMNKRLETLKLDLGNPPSATLAAEVAQRIHAAETLYESGRNHFGQAKSIDDAARGTCVAALRAARALLPDYQIDPAVSASVIDTVPGVRREMAEAEGDPHVRLTGTGQVRDYVDGTNPGLVSAELASIRDEARELPGGHLLQGGFDSPQYDSDAAQTALPGANSAREFKSTWILHNKEVFEAAAERYGLPAELVAAVAYEELGGRPLARDMLIFGAREHAPSGLTELAAGPGLMAPADQTSIGAIDIQVRRAAEALGYDPANLSHYQRLAVMDSVWNAKENVFVVAKHLADLKQATTFPFVSGDQLTFEQQGELALRYGQGPFWATDDYAGNLRVFGDNLRAVQPIFGR